MDWHEANISGASCKPRSRQGGLWEHWPQVLRYLPPCHREYWCCRQQSSEEWRLGNVNELGGKAEYVGWTLWKASQRWIWLGPWSPVQRAAVRRSTYPNLCWHGEEGHLKDEVGQSCRSIRHSGRDDQGSRWYRCQHDPWSYYCDYPWSQVSLSTFTRARVMSWTEATIEA